MNSPTLLVGLGGTGSKIVAKVSEMISDDQRRNISCVIFDTDANDIPEIKRHHSEIKVVQTSARMTVGEYLEEDHYARDTWFPVNPPLEKKVLSEGAGQVRSISRLGFESAVRAGKMEPLHEAIQELYKVDRKRNDQALRIIIVSSLAGGTGSGLILPVAVYIRNYLDVNFHQNANISRGFFLLPEVFYGAIPADQRDNLKSNAYASLRELDAFLMKGNKTLSEEYRDSVKLELPIPGTNEHKDYDVSPYDFCFLFDAQNANGEKLNSLEQYMDHAANIIYSMSIGPMNKRSNSSEDNTIRKLAKEKGRNRYAGAGASRLIYPYDDICRLIGLNWAGRSISDQWLEYDKRFEEMKALDLKKQEEGLAVDDRDRHKEYVSQVQSDSGTKKPFASKICRDVDRNGSKDQDSIQEEYLGSLKNYVAELITSDENHQNEFVRNAQKIAKSILDAKGENALLEDDKIRIKDAVQKIQVYLTECRRFLSRNADNTSYSLFFGAKNEGSSSSDVFLLNHLKDSKGDSLHPNAVRYALARIEEVLEQELYSLESSVKNLKADVDKFEKKPYFGLDDAGELKLDDIKPSLRNKLTKKRCTEIESEFEFLEKTTSQIENWLIASFQHKVLTDAQAYVHKLLESYDGFYDGLKNHLKKIDEQKEEIYHKYTQAPGMTVRYVAADPECLDKLKERFPYTGSLLGIDSKLSKKITERIFDFAAMTKQPNASRYFEDLFENEILDYYQQSVHDKTASQLDQGILNAIKLEADLMLDEDDKASRGAVDRYVRGVLRETRELSTPFIEKPSELNASSIPACAFNESLMPKRGDESFDAKLISEELVEKGGLGDEDVDKNEILFYQSYYGLRANSLSKFAPPRNSVTHTKNGGEHFNAYQALIKGIHPNAKVSQEISPHIDKTWHLAAKMPDLDESNQLIEEYGINAAFFWTVVMNLLDLHKESSGREIYELKAIRLGLEDGDLLTDSTTRASTLNDVLDSLAIQPHLVEEIRGYANQRITDESENHRQAQQTETYDQLRAIHVPLSEKYRGYPEQFSLLDLPGLLKVSIPVTMQNDRKLLDLLTVTLRETVRYLSGFCSPDELAGQVDLFMKEQLNSFDHNLKQIQAANADRESAIPGGHSLTTDVFETTANFLEEQGLYELAAECRQKADAGKVQTF